MEFRYKLHQVSGSRKQRSETKSIAKLLTPTLKGASHEGYARRVKTNVKAEPDHSGAGGGGGSGF